MNIDDYSPNRISDRLQIQDVVYLWGRAIDRLDFESMREIFFPDATDNHGIFNGDREEMIAWLRERHKTVRFSAHVVTNILIEFAGPDLAIVESHITTTQLHSPRPQMPGDSTTPPRATHMVALGRYADRFERRDGKWGISKRTVIFDSQMIFDAPDDAGVMPPEFTMSSRDQNDFIYQLRREAGLAR